MNSVSDQIKSLLLFHNHLFDHEENLVSDRWNSERVSSSG